MKEAVDLFKWLRQDARGFVRMVQNQMGDKFLQERSENLAVTWLQQ
jgi:hypothetical protein